MDIWVQANVHFLDQNKKTKTKNPTNLGIFNIVFNGHIQV